MFVPAHNAPTSCSGPFGYPWTSVAPCARLVGFTSRDCHHWRRNGQSARQWQLPPKIAPDESQLAHRETIYPDIGSD